MSYKKELTKDQATALEDFWYNRRFLFPTVDCIFNCPSKVYNFCDNDGEITLSHLLIMVDHSKFIEYSDTYRSLDLKDTLEVTSYVWSVEKRALSYPEIKSANNNEDWFQDVRCPTDDEWTLYLLEKGEHLDWCRPQNIYKFMEKFL